jgi:hypothetical protein
MASEMSTAVTRESLKMIKEVVVAAEKVAKGVAAEEPGAVDGQMSMHGLNTVMEKMDGEADKLKAIREEGADEEANPDGRLLA